MMERSSLDKNIAPDQESCTPSESAWPLDAFSLEHWETAKSQLMSRRHLLTLIKLSSGAAASATLLAACSSGGSQTASNSSTISATQAPAATQASTMQAPVENALAKVADIPLNSAKTFSISNQKNPGVIVHLPDQQFVAFDTTCTHMQCEVSYNPSSKLLECPCHGAKFDPAKEGAVVEGPAEIPLTPIRISVHADGSVTKV